MEALFFCLFLQSNQFRMTKKQALVLDRMDDCQLVELLLANNEEAVRYVFFQRCDGMFYHVMKSVFDEQVEKEELINEFYLFLSADDWRRLRQFEFRSSLNTWLTIVATRFFQQKKEVLWTNRTSTDTLLLMEEAKQVPDDHDILSEMSRLELYEAIERHPKPRERFALLGALAGKDAKTIAEEMECSVVAVYNLIKKAKKALIKKMKGIDNETTANSGDR